jgi:broad specificity phosphatase PhoE
VLLLVRHGRTAANASRQLLGRRDVPLDELGMRQAEALGQVPELRGAARVVTSPLARTRATAAGLGPPVTVDPRWTEVDYGMYDGMGVEAVPELFGEWERDLEYVPEGGESLAQVGRRVRDACRDLWPEAAEQDVVVVTHVSPIKAAVAWALGVGDETSWRMFVDVASLTRVGAGRRDDRPGSGTEGLPVPSLRTFNETYYRPST